ncbi:hypothetical protein CDAR_283941 [Caerostris darwini]|uniref:Uncharacterized protein n=1 Tax=Caerostris darwini TaxID=1538125 RepID=A0AAV4PLS9_9ARAC|nr:hypothetical protein CDAR_283941 [Caerostris darwini]
MKHMTYKKKTHHDLHLWGYSAVIGFLTFICSIGPKANSSEQQLEKNEGMCSFDKRNQEMKKKNMYFQQEYSHQENIASSFAAILTLNEFVLPKAALTNREIK